MTSLIYQTNGGGSLTLQATNTASNPILTLPALTGNVITSADTGTITNSMLAITALNGVSIGATTQSTGAFTTLNATGAITAYTTTNNQAYVTSGAGTITIASGTSGTINNMSIGATTPSTGAFTTLTTTADATFGGTGEITLPNGTTAQRSGTPTSGMIRFNTSTNQFEGYNGTAWGTIGGGATGGGSDQVFVQNGQTVTTSYTIPTGKNAESVGPITVNSGAVVTVSSGSRWVVL
jgi:hypothetical protein